MRFVRQFSMTLVVVTMGAAMALAGGGEVILERSFQVGPGATLAFDSDRGGVAILGEERDDIFIQVMARDMDPDKAMDALELEFHETLGGLEVRARFRGESGWLSSLFGGGGGGVFFDVRVPRSTELEIDNGSGGFRAQEIDADVSVDNGSGGIQLQSIRGSVSIDNGSGGIRVSRIEGSLQIDNGSGGVRVDDIRGDVNIDNGSGGVSVAKVVGDVSVDNGSGGIQLDDVEGALEADTSSGGINARMTGHNLGVQAETGSGGVRIEVPASWGADVEMSSRKGDVIVEGWSNLAVTDAHNFRGTLGGGGPRISLSSESGDVELIAR